MIYRAQARCELVAESDEHPSYASAATEAKERLLAAEKLAFSVNGVTTTGMGIQPMSDKFFEALEKAKITDAALERVADLERQLAECKSAIRRADWRLHEEVKIAKSRGDKGAMTNLESIRGMLNASVK